MKGVRRKFERGCESKSVEGMESRNLKQVQFTEQAPDIMGKFLYLPGTREMEATPLPFVRLQSPQCPPSQLQQCIFYDQDNLNTRCSRRA
jgi:hypothetical protein